MIVIVFGSRTIIFVGGNATTTCILQARQDVILSEYAVFSGQSASRGASRRPAANDLAAVRHRSRTTSLG